MKSQKRVVLLDFSLMPRLVILSTTLFFHHFPIPINVGAAAARPSLSVSAAELLCSVQSNLFVLRTFRPFSNPCRTDDLKRKAFEFFKCSSSFQHRCCCCTTAACEQEKVLLRCAAFPIRVESALRSTSTGLDARICS